MHKQTTLEDIKPIKSHYLYNMLQDFRHLVVFDLRPQAEHDDSHIRDSFSFNNDVNKNQVEQIIQLSIRKAEEKEKKYPQLKKIRRFFFIALNDIDLKDQSQASKIKLALSLVASDAANKFYLLSGGYKEYFQAYPFTCLVRSKLQKLKAEGASQQDQQKWLLYPYCRFPSQIIPGKLYLGNIFSSNSQKQLEDLKIKCLVDFIAYEQKGGNQQEQSVGKQIPSFKTDGQKYNFFQLPFSRDVAVDIDFDLINEQIDKRVSLGSTLLYCEDGETTSAAFAISYLMFKAKLDVTMATLKVCQAISRTDITKWIYTQLLMYKPQIKK